MSNGDAFDEWLDDVVSKVRDVTGFDGWEARPGAPAAECDYDAVPVVFDPPEVLDRQHYSSLSVRIEYGQTPDEAARRAQHCLEVRRSRLQHILDAYTPEDDDQ